jgi:hypothetical protein
MSNELIQVIAYAVIALVVIGVPFIIRKLKVKESELLAVSIMLNVLAELTEKFNLKGKAGIMPVLEAVMEAINIGLKANADISNEEKIKLVFEESKRILSDKDVPVDASMEKVLKEAAVLFIAYVDGE